MGGFCWGWGSGGVRGLLRELFCFFLLRFGGLVGLVCVLGKERGRKEGRGKGSGIDERTKGGHRVEWEREPEMGISR